MRHLSSSMTTNHPAWQNDLLTLDILKHEEQRFPLWEQHKRKPFHSSLLLKSPIEDCELCRNTRASLRLITQDDQFLLLFINTCHLCLMQLKSLLMKHIIVPLDLLQKYAQTKQYLIKKE